MSHQSNYISFLMESAVNGVGDDNVGPGYNSGQAEDIDHVGKNKRSYTTLGKVYTFYFSKCFVACCPVLT